MFPRVGFRISYQLVITHIDMWQDWVNGILGLWVILLPFIGLGGDVTTLVITGIVIAVLGFWAASMGNKKPMGGGGVAM